MHVCYLYSEKYIAIHITIDAVDSDAMSKRVMAMAPSTPSRSMMTTARRIKVTGG